MFCSKCNTNHLDGFTPRTVYRQDGLEIFAYYIGKCTHCGADMIEKEIFKSEWHEDISMETFLEENPNFSFEKEKVEKVEKPSKLIIHETDCHGSGFVHCKGKTDYYSYDDEMGDIRAAVEGLIDLGFIKPEQVIILEQDQLYEKFAELLEKE